ncbi:MAG: hypothetical protein WC584_04520 [Candidatus Pacearchaeota archaeon]
MENFLFSIPKNMGIINSHPYKTGSFESKEDFKEKGNFQDE